MWVYGQVAVNKDLPNIEAPAIGYLLFIWLQDAINDLYQKVEIVNGQSGGSKIADYRIGTESLYLYLVKDRTQLLHTTAIALKLSQQWQKSTMELASEIAVKLYQISRKSGLRAGECTIEVVPPGWINLRLSDTSVGNWLQRFAQQPPWVGQGSVGEFLRQNLPSQPEAWKRAKIPNSQTVFRIQYAHARCCSLLRMAHREKAIELAKPDPDRTPAYFRLVNPNPIPWLTANEQLRLIHPAERNLIYHLLSIPDILYCPPPKQALSSPWEKLSINLSQSWEKFHSQCRIWGEVRAEAPELAQARLGLILATQALLRLMLEDLLGIPAPLEL